MNFTAPFLIIVIIVSLILLYKIADVKFFVFQKKHINKKQEKTVDDKPKLETKKSFIRRKEDKPIEKKEEQKQITNKPSENAVVTKVFGLQNSNSEITKRIDEIEIQNKTFDQNGLLKAPVVVANHSETTANVQYTQPVDQSHIDEEKEKMQIKKLFENPFPKPKSPAFETKLDKINIYNTLGKDNLQKGNKPPFDFNKMFEEDDGDDLFEDDLDNFNKPKLNEEEFVEKKIVGDSIAVTKPSKNTLYWL